VGAYAAVRVVQGEDTRDRVAPRSRRRGARSPVGLPGRASGERHRAAETSEGSAGLMWTSSGTAFANIRSSYECTYKLQGQGVSLDAHSAAGPIYARVIGILPWPSRGSAWIKC